VPLVEEERRKGVSTLCGKGVSGKGVGTLCVRIDPNGETEKEFPMPRKPRFYLPGVPVHVVQRGNDRQAVFYANDDYAVYLSWLREGAAQHGCLVHAYVLMTNHVHLLLTPNSRNSISRMIQFLGRKYVGYVNHRYGRSGTLWEGRHKGSVIDSSGYSLACSRYIELNPVRAGMVESPSDYRWSSYGANAFGMDGRWLAPTPEYIALGDDDQQRRFRYRELFRCSLEPDQVHAIRSCVQTGTPLGNDRFRAQVEQLTGRRVGQSRRGRPRARPEAPNKGY